MVHRAMRIFLVSLILLLNLTVTPAAVPSLLEAALQKLQADENHWAYTQTTQVFDRQGEPEDGVTVERFDPSLPYDQQWTLLQQDGRAPTAREERAWRKRKDREMKRREEKSLGEIMDLERAREVERYAGQVVFEVPLQPGASRRLPAEKFAVLMAVDESSATLSEFMLKTTDSFRALGGEKVDRIEIKADFAMVDPQYVPQPRRIVASGAGRLLFFRVGGSAEITWSEFKRVKPYEDRFDVQIGELKVFGF